MKKRVFKIPGGLEVVGEDHGDFYIHLSPLRFWQARDKETGCVIGRALRDRERLVRETKNFLKKWHTKHGRESLRKYFRSHSILHQFKK
jgi:hypothetical protein